LASTTEAVFPDKNPDPFIVRATGVVSGVIGLRLWTIVPKSRRWKLSAVSGAGGHRLEGSIPSTLPARNEDEQPVNGALRGSVLVGFRPAGVHSAQSSE
jgi:hypothetical protein